MSNSNQSIMQYSPMVSASVPPIRFLPWVPVLTSQYEGLLLGNLSWNRSFFPWSYFWSQCLITATESKSKQKLAAGEVESCYDEPEHTVLEMIMEEFGTWARQVTETSEMNRLFCRSLENGRLMEEMQILESWPMKLQTEVNILSILFA